VASTRNQFWLVKGPRTRMTNPNSNVGNCISNVVEFSSLSFHLDIIMQLESKFYRTFMNLDY